MLWIHRPSVKFCKNVVPKSVRIRHSPWVNMGAGRSYMLRVRLGPNAMNASESTEDSLKSK